MLLGNPLQWWTSSLLTNLIIYCLINCHYHLYLFNPVSFCLSFWYSPARIIWQLASFPNHTHISLEFIYCTSSTKSPTAISYDCTPITSIVCIMKCVPGFVLGCFFPSSSHRCFVSPFTGFLKVISHRAEQSRCFIETNWFFSSVSQFLRE